MLDGPRDCERICLRSSCIVCCYNELKADVWSLGITALELYKGFPPLARFDTMEIFTRIAHGDPPSFASYTDAFPSHPSHAFQSFIESVLRKDPRDRPDAEDVLEHRWFQQAEEGKREFMALIEKIPDIAENSTFDLDPQS